MGSRVLVGNPGSIQSLGSMAAGLARAGMLREYVVPVTSPDGHWAAAAKMVPGRAGQSLQAELRRREPPPGVNREQISHRASAAELVCVAVQRSDGLRRFAPITWRWRDRIFDRRLASAVCLDDDAVATSTGTALHTLCRARTGGILGVIVSRIAHFSQAARLLSEEAELQPAFASTLQYHRHPQETVARWEAELDLADVIFVLSNYHRTTFEQAGVDPSKLVVAAPGIDVELFRPLPQPPRDRFVVGFVGQIGQRKGLSYLINAIPVSGVPDAELVLVGPVIGTAEPWKAVPRVQHLPAQSRRALPAVYATFDVFAFPSLVEGFGLAALEAMACGVPTIVSEHTFASDVITDGVDGFIVPIRNSEAIAARIRYLHANPADRQRMGEAARRRALEFSLIASGDRAAHLLRERLTS